MSNCPYYATGKPDKQDKVKLKRKIKINSSENINNVH